MYKMNIFKMSSRELINKVCEHMNIELVDVNYDEDNVYRITDNITGEVIMVISCESGEVEVYFPIKVLEGCLKFLKSC